MKTLLHPLFHPRSYPSMRAALGVVFLVGMWQLAAAGAGWSAFPVGVNASVLLVTALAVLCCTLFRRVRSEDRVVRLEADLCREQVARSRADHALAEADLLLARVSGRGAVSPQHDPVGQLGLVQAELMQMQYGAADPVVAARIDMLRTRLELVARSVRYGTRGTEVG